MRFSIHSRLIPNSSAHVTRFCARPSCSRILAVRLFLAWTLAVAQMQLILLYPRSLSRRSMDVSGGRGPMSARKLENNNQASQTFIPRPPYSVKSLLLGLLHRSSMWRQVRHSGVSVIPWRSRPVISEHPHVRWPPHWSAFRDTTAVPPQSHRHIHMVIFFLGGAAAITSRWVNRFPIRSSFFNGVPA
jgi:hypothetical protein